MTIGFRRVVVAHENGCQVSRTVYLTDSVCLSLCAMTLSTRLRNRINQLPKGKPFGYEDLQLSRTEYTAAAKILERLQKQGVLRKVSRGLFYIPEQTVFGELSPGYRELLQSSLYENGKRIAYETGTSLYNQLGLTTQLAFRIKIASRRKRININRQSLKADAVKSYAEVTESNYEILGLLDAFRDIRKIPDCTIQQALRRLGFILKDWPDSRLHVLIRYAQDYPPRVRALVGAVLQHNGYSGTELDSLKESLNPLTTFRLGISDNDLPVKSEWNIQ